MSKFLITTSQPKNLEKNEFIIGAPDFHPEIRQCRGKKPKSREMTVNYLREVIAAVGQKYLGEEFDALRTINVSRFVGVPCGSDEEVHNVLIKIFEIQCPELLRAYVSSCFKQRPARTNLIYYTGAPRFCTALIEAGWEQIFQKELDELKSGKPKKVVGKPAITAEKAALLNADDV